MPAVRTTITHFLVLVALATLPACQGCSDRRSRAAVGDGAAIETRRLETVRLEGAPAGRSTALDLPAPRVRSFELLAAGKAPRQPLRYAVEAGEGALAVTARIESRE